MALPVRRPNLPSTLDPSILPELPERQSQQSQGRWDPFHPVDRLDGLWSPVADLEETEDSYIVEVELPGAKKDDVTVEYREGELAISGEIREREHTGRIRWKTRRSGRFDYLVTMPGDADADRISASLADGVLTITVPKSEKSKPRRISVFASESPLEGKVLGQSQ